MWGSGQGRGQSLFLRSALIAALCWAMPAAAENSALIGLTRVEQASSWKAVGRLDTGGGFCTATLIAPDLVLTAAHCTYGTDGTPIAAKALTFRAGFRQGRVEAERNVIQIARPEAYRYDGADVVARIANDVALLRLSIPIATHVINPFVVEPRILREGEVSVVSYGRGREDLPSFQDTCSVLHSFQGVVAMDCNVTFGSSGACGTA